MQTIGRYQPRKKIGSGNQGSVYLCTDPQLKRKVAIKLLNKPLLGGKKDAEAFEQEAEALGRFQHQNIVSVYDVGTFRERPYIVFEFVEGELLSDHIRDKNMELAEIIELFSGIVDGVAQAHKADVIHRDLKPQNIMINKDGVPKIMDFGIALLLEEQATTDVLVGTPRYMAPEYIRKKVVSPAIDVFALGAIFYEMLTGNPAFGGKSTADVLTRVLIGPPKRPSAMNEMADDVIDGICLKALAANPADRYEDARRLQDMLSDYKKNHQDTVLGDSHGKATLEFLYRRMQRKKDFPALAESIRSINELQSNSEKDAEKLAAVIVNDFALTNKILKVVNSAYYGSFSGKISTISRAIVVLGIDGIRAMAASLIFFEHVSNRSVARKLKREMAASMFRAVFAQEVSKSADLEGSEEAFLCAMFYQLGKVLVTYYLPDEDQEIERLLGQGELTETEAAMQVMGVVFEDIGAFVAGQWNFPDMIANCMRKPEPGKPPKPHSIEDSYRLVTHLSDSVTRLLAEGGSLEDAKKAMQRYKDVIRIDTSKIDNIVERARSDFAMMAEKLVKGKPEDPYLMQLQGRLVKPAAEEEEAGSSISLEAVMEQAEAEEAEELNAEDILSRGLQEATNILLESGNVSQVFNTVLETLYRGMEFRRVLLCLLSGPSYTARLGFGEDIKEVLNDFKVTLDSSKNVFSLALEQGIDVYIADVHDHKMHDD
ncbi:MAG: HDOD domain-containing protein, partial [Chromatiales bacterium]